MSENSLEYFFRYYENQREEIRSRINERASMTFQMLILSATATLAYVEISDNFLTKMIIGIFIICLGVIGYLANKTQRDAIKNHIDRARIARSKFEEIDNIAKNITIGSSKKDATTYGYLHLLVLAYGLILIFVSFLQTSV